MKLKFDATQAYQLEAIKTIIDVLKGQPITSSSFEVKFKTEGASIALTEKGISNRLVLKDEQILENIQSIQAERKLPISKCLEPLLSDDCKQNYCSLNFTVEMETGTGKTYTFLRTIYELNKVYGFKKFVIVVPNIAIREGTLKNLQLTYEHFQSFYENPLVNSDMYDSSKITKLRHFATSDAIQILVINIDSFAKDNNIINTLRETGVKPIEYIQSCSPIVIVDEPQNMESELRKSAIGNLNPLFTLRYSATHRKFYNLVYSLNPVEAYDLGLVKQIEVDGIVAEANSNKPFIELISIPKPTPNGKTLKAKIAIYTHEKNGIKRKEFVISPSEDLFYLSSWRDVYKDGYILTSIHRDPDYIGFSNGIKVYYKQPTNDSSDEIMKFQIERTIRRHFEKEVRYWKRGSEESRNSPKRIKVLSLFFIDKVSNYRIYDSDGETHNGKFAKWFEELFSKLSIEFKNEYPDLYTDMPIKEYFDSDRVHDTDIPPMHPNYMNASKVHNGYFSLDKGRIKDTSGTSKADNDTYTLIMKDKERLLSTDEPLRFIFSHSTLREGWDNPNVFQICTLNESKSENRKRQEIGRGLRLCVDGTGERVFDKNINILTVIANESYEDFSQSLQEDIQRETSVSFSGRIKNAREKQKVKLTKELTPENCPLFFEIWDRIKYRTRYRVEYDTDELINKAVYSLKDFNTIPMTKRPMLEAKRASFRYSNEGIKTIITDTDRKATDDIKYPIPDIYTYIQNRLDISRQTIFQILKKSGRLGEFAINPQIFLDNIVKAIENALASLMIDGIKYEKINDKNYEMSMFETEEIETYCENLFTVTKNEKTIYNYIAIDSTIETKFACDCETDNNVKFFFKLPKKFKIPTPIGNYTPDWAVIFDNDKRIYFVAETKPFSIDLRLSEMQKINCGKAHYLLASPNDVAYQKLTELSELY